MRLNKSSSEDNFIVDDEQEETQNVEYESEDTIIYDEEDEETDRYPAFLNPLVKKFKAYRKFENMLFESDKTKKIAMAISIVVFITIIVIAIFVMR